MQVFFLTNYIDSFIEESKPKNHETTHLLNQEPFNITTLRLIKL